MRAHPAIPDPSQQPTRPDRADRADRAVHVPGAPEGWYELPPAMLLARTAVLLGVPVQLPHATVSPADPIPDLARTRVAAEALAALLLTRYVICPDCAARPDRQEPCAREWFTVAGLRARVSREAIHAISRQLATGHQPGWQTHLSDPRWTRPTRHPVIDVRAWTWRPPTRGARVSDLTIEAHLEVRDRLSLAAAEHDAHHLPGGTLLYRMLGEVEETIAVLAPALWAEQAGTWLETDAARLHTGLDPHTTDCDICTTATRAGTATPPRAA